MATASKTKVFAGLRCPHCGEADGIVIKVDSLALECSGCGEEITRFEVEALVSTWQRLLGWLDSAAAFAAPTK